MGCSQLQQQLTVLHQSNNTLASNNNNLEQKLISQQNEIQILKTQLKITKEKAQCDGEQAFYYKEEHQKMEKRLSELQKSTEDQSTQSLEFYEEKQRKMQQRIEELEAMLQDKCSALSQLSIDSQQAQQLIE